MNAYERCGHLLEALEESRQSHAKTLALLMHLKRGEVKLENVTVTDQGWRLEPETIEPAQVPDAPKARLESNGSKAAGLVSQKAKTDRSAAGAPIHPPDVRGGKGRGERGTVP